MGAKDQVAAAPDVAQGRREALPRSRAAAPLLAPGARKPAAMVAIGCLLLVSVLGVASVHQGHGDAIDRAVDPWVIGLNVPAHLLSGFSRLGGGVEMLALTAGLALASLALRGLSGLLLAVLSVPVAAALTEFVLKPLVHRTIGDSLTYPSGHTTGLFALATIIAVVALGSRRGTRPALRIAVVIAAAVIACAVGFAMIALQYHYFTDTVGGAAVGSGVVLGTAFLLDSRLIHPWLSRLGR